MRKLIVSNNVTLDGRVDDVLDWSIPGDDEDFVRRNTTFSVRAMA